MPKIMPTTPLPDMLKKLKFYYKFQNFQTLFPKDLQEKFVEFSADQETQEYLKNCNSVETKPFTFIGQRLCYQFFMNFMMQTSVHAFLDRGKMFVMSGEQIRRLLGVNLNMKYSKMIENYKSIADLGAGDGHVSIKVAQAFNLSHDKIAVTDMSTTMKYRLKQRGFSLRDEHDWYFDTTFDAIFMLNLLDRCEKPYSMLDQAYSILVNKPHGRLIIALVFPINQSIEWRKSRRPDEYINVNRRIALEEQVCSFLKNVMDPSGFELERFSRVPYLCEGDITTAYYAYTNVVFCFKPIVGFFEKNEKKI